MKSPRFARLGMVVLVLAIVLILVFQVREAMHPNNRIVIKPYRGVIIDTFGTASN